MKRDSFETTEVFEPSPQHQAMVVVVDNNESARDSIEQAFCGAGLKVAMYTCATEALEKCDPDVPGCYLVDIDLPDTNGLVLRQQLLGRGCYQPFIAMSACADIPAVVESFHCGAMDFFEKPLNTNVVFDSVKSAIQTDIEAREVRRLLDGLTNREQQLLPMIVEGELSNEISDALDISPRTVEVHRRNIVRKMDVDSVAQLVRKVTEYHQTHRRLTSRLFTQAITLLVGGFLEL